MDDTAQDIYEMTNLFPKHTGLPMMIWVGAVTGLVLLQPNFSMGAMIFLLSMLLLFIGRAKFSHLALTFTVLVPLLALYMLSAEDRKSVV